MTIENSLKQMIKEQFGSMTEFSRRCELPNSTINSVLNRGIQNSNLGNVLRICEVLRISADALAEGEIIPKPVKHSTLDIADIVSNAKAQLLSSEQVTVFGCPADSDTVNAIIDTFDFALQIAQKKCQRKADIK